MRRVVFAALLLALLPAVTVHAQTTQDLRASQLRLDSIRAERERLQNEMQSLQSRVRDASREVANLTRQRAASASALQELDLQMSLLTAQVEQTQAELAATQYRLQTRTEAMHSRLRSIYKRGSMHSARVLLGAESFADLLNRYKYLNLLALHDRRVLEDASRLERILVGQETQLEQTLGQLESLRMEKGVEVSQLQRLETRSRVALDQYKQQETRVATAIGEAEQAEARLTSVISTLERARRDDEARRRASGTAVAPEAISTRALGTLNWPVEGNVIYRYGPVQKSNGITLINKGIGIAAPVGSPVRTIEAGDVALARPFEGYGRTVMVSHGGGYYTLYMYLQSIAVREGQRLATGEVVGTVGGQETPEGAHLYFQVHAPVRGQTPEPVDPLTWLRSRSRSP